MKKGFSVRKLAKEVGVSPTTLSNIENHLQLCSEALLEKIAAVLGCTVEELKIKKGW